MKKRNKQHGFSLLELLVVVAIIGILSSVVLFAANAARVKAKDVKRKAEVSGIGRLITGSCYVPNAGPGNYDIANLVTEFVANNPQYADQVAHIPKDPSASGAASLYMYIVDVNGKCAVYANLENGGEDVTLQNISTPTAGGGTGVFEAAGNGWNGSSKYFQVSN